MKAASHGNEFSKQFDYLKISLDEKQILIDNLERKLEEQHS